jgi:hypothetical protein
LAIDGSLIVECGLAIDGSLIVDWAAPTRGGPSYVRRAG